MKKYAVLAIIALIAILFTYCHSGKKATAAVNTKITYEANIKPLIAGKCTPCHIPANGGNKKAYDNYTAAKGDVDGILHRVMLNPGEKGYMPFKKEKLSDSAIAVIQQWKADGLLEK